MEPVIDPRVSALPPPAATSWAAIIAGAFVAAAVSLTLLALGSGLGFAVISPWQGQGVSMTTFAVTTAIWLIVMQWLSSAVGGYTAGRLRTRWIGTHTHEVFFRDTAHGFITWAVATVMVAGVLYSGVTAGLRAGTRAATSVAATAAEGEAGSTTPGYVYGLDRLFRSSGGTAAVAQNTQDARADATHIIVQAVVTHGAVSEEDQAYMAGLVSARTGISPDDARRRVSEFVATANDVRDKVKADADAARKAAAEAAIFLALALVVGAFIASLSAALGGRLRDEHP